jgi:ribosomal protein S27E
VHAEALGIVDRLGYLICRSCREDGRGREEDAQIFGAPHSEEPCDACGRILDGSTGEKEVPS